LSVKLKESLPLYISQRLETRKGIQTCLTFLPVVAVVRDLQTVWLLKETIND